MMGVLIFVIGMLAGAILALPFMFIDNTETFKAIDKKIANKIKET